MMLSRVEKERIKSLLRETITLLCKNGLPYRREFNLEALIGITLDKKDVLLISLNELIRGHDSPHAKLCHVVSGAGRDGPKKRHCKAATERRQPKKRLKSSPSAKPDHGDNADGNCAAPRDASQTDRVDSNHVQVSGDETDSTTESSSSSESEFGSDDLTEDQRSLLAKMKEAVNQQIKKESGGSPNRDNTGLQPMDLEESQKIWRKAFEMAHVTKQSDSRRKKAESCTGDGKDKGDTSEQEAQESAESLPSPMCHICGKTMSTEKNLTKHVRRHLGMFSVYCDQCGKGFFDRTDLDSHTAKHKDTKLYQCDMCGRSYSHKRGLYKHIRKDHQNGENKDIDVFMEKAARLERSTSEPPVSAPVTSTAALYQQASGPCVLSQRPLVSQTPNMPHVSDMPADLSQPSHLAQLHQATDLSQATSAQHALSLAQASIMSAPPPPHPPPPMIHHHGGLSSTPILPLSSNLPPHYQHPAVEQHHPPGIHQPPYPRF